MSACPKCNAEASAGARYCSACGASMQARSPQSGHGLAALFTHIPHPHIHLRRQRTPKSTCEHLPPPRNLLVRFNNFLAVKITDAVGTMWCAYLFAALALVSLPDAIRGGTGALVAWTAQTFIQLVLLSIIIVGQKVASEASDKRALDTYNDAEALLHEAVQIQQHLAAQDVFLQRLVEAVATPAAERRVPPSGDVPA